MNVDLAGVVARFPRERTWLLPALHAVQDAVGHLPDDALASVADHLRVPRSEVYGVATGYPEFRLRASPGRRVRFCTGVSCRLAGGVEVERALVRRFGPAGAGRDGAPAAVTLEPADCFFACAVGPVIEVDGACRGRVTAADVTSAAGGLAPPPAPAPDRRAGGSAPVPALSPAGRPGTDGAGKAGPPALAGARSAGEALERMVEGARRRVRPALRLLVQTGTCGRAVGAGALLVAIREAAIARGLAAEVLEGACNGMCYAAPLVEVQREGWPRMVIERVAPALAGALLDELLAESGDVARAGLAGVVWSDRPTRGLVPASGHPFWAGQERVLLSRCGRVDPGDLDDALLGGAYRALAGALDGTPGGVIARVKESALLGRGGAFFPAAVKWEACARAAGTPKYLVVNGEEGEPGIFKDRHLMEGDPHQVLEGALLAAYAAGASRVILYVHGEAHLSAARLARAVAQAEAAGLVGDRLLGRPVACRVELRRGAGGFVLGEETALLESIEGRRAQPRTRPPFPVESGLWGKPTVVNNVETLAAVPWILERGPAWFAGLGTGKAAGTKIFGLSGPIRRPGVVETRHGVTLRALLQEIGGGLADGRALRGAVVGGPSGTVVPATLFDVPMEPRERVSPGTGGVVAVPEDASVVDIVRTLLGFNAAESCGKCTPCREGAPRLLAMIDELRAAPDPPAMVRRMGELADAVRQASLCGLGQAAPLALLAALESFPEEFGAVPA